MSNNTPSASEQFINELLTKDLMFDTPETRNSDRLDFVSLHVAVVKQALLKAYEKGAKSSDPFGFYCKTVNPAIWAASQDFCNPCTQFIKDNFSEEKPCLVLLRDGTYDKVWFKKEVYEQEGFEPEVFEYFTSKAGRRWHDNAISYTTLDWDIISVESA